MSPAPQSSHYAPLLSIRATSFRLPVGTSELGAKSARRHADFSTVAA